MLKKIFLLFACYLSFGLNNIVWPALQQIHYSQRIPEDRALEDIQASLEGRLKKLRSEELNIINETEKKISELSEFVKERFSQADFASTLKCITVNYLEILNMQKSSAFDVWLFQIIKAYFDPLKEKQVPIEVDIKLLLLKEIVEKNDYLKVEDEVMSPARLNYLQVMANYERDIKLAIENLNLCAVDKKYLYNQKILFLLVTFGGSLNLLLLFFKNAIDPSFFKAGIIASTMLLGSPFVRSWIIQKEKESIENKKESIEKVYQENLLKIRIFENFWKRLG